MNDFINNIKRLQSEYDKEYLAKRLNIVTTEMGKGGDSCDGAKRVTVVKYHTVKPKEYFTDRHYESCNGATYQRYIKDIPPRKFYTETELRNYMAVLNKWAGRTIEDDEMRLLLRYITRGRHYQLVCLVDVTEQLKDELVWRDIKG